MEKNRQQLLQQLSATDPKIARLFRQQQQLERQLENLEKRFYLNSDEQSTIVTLKKQKLKNKDRLEALLYRYQQEDECERPLARQRVLASA